MTLPQKYAADLFRSVEAASPVQKESVIDDFFVLLAKRGHRGLLHRILKEYERLVVKERRRSRIVLSVHTAEGRLKDTGDIERALKLIGEEKASVETLIAPGLIGGFVLEGRGKRIDGSFHRSLLELYDRFVKG